MKKRIFLSLAFLAASPLYGQSASSETASSDTLSSVVARQPQSKIVNQQSKIPLPQSKIVNQQSKIPLPQSKIVNQQSEIPNIEGSWILDTAIITTTAEDGSVEESIYLLGDTLKTALHPQPPQRVIITPNKVVFEYSSAIVVRSKIEHLREGNYSFDGEILRICFVISDEFICRKIDEEHLHLHYTCYPVDEEQQFVEHGIFKFIKAAKQ
jgi:hypothetical protein